MHNFFLLSLVRLSLSQPQSAAARGKFSTSLRLSYSADAAAAAPQVAELRLSRDGFTLFQLNSKATCMHTFIALYRLCTANACDEAAKWVGMACIFCLLNH